MELIMNTAISNVSDVRENIRRTELRNIIDKKAVNTVFQPIISLRTGQVYGYEALSRVMPEYTSLNIEELFNLALKENCMWDFDAVCRQKAIENAALQHITSKLFLNVDPHIIHDPKFFSGMTNAYLAKYSLSPENIVFEITEKSTLNDMPAFLNTLEHYSNQGFQIALDDVGDGYSGLKLIAEAQPNFIKIDIGLIRDVNSDKMKRNLVKVLVSFCNVSGIVLIAEGIETNKELDTLMTLGVEFGQGYLIARPNTMPAKPNAELVEYINRFNITKNSKKYSEIPVANVMMTAPTFEMNDLNEKAYELFSENSKLYGIPVIKDNKPMGLLVRNKFFEKYGHRFGRDLYSKKPVALIMDHHPLIVEKSLPLTWVSKQATARDGSNTYDMIIITNNGVYEGVTNVISILESLTEHRIHYARHLNPLTGLPGNLIIENEIQNCINANKRFYAMYVDLNKFKRINDKYGYKLGDDVICLIGKVLSNIYEENAERVFVGHIGGDDFLFIDYGEHPEKICTRIIADFKKSIFNYSPTICQEISVAISVVNGYDKKYKTPAELSSALSLVKKKCKAMNGNAYLIEE
ncbi:MAG: GGDEF domain-containing protein [Hyphomonadaceae bacterium]|nr:GGDEF domain-containing protein [Clostridia bacterium]